MSLDVYHGLHREDFDGEDWRPINNPPILDDPESDTWNSDVSGSRQAAIDYIKYTQPEIYCDACKYEKSAE